MNKSIIITAALLGTVAVTAGAFGAHGLKAVITPAQLAVWHTAVEYNFYHVFALLFLATFARGKNSWVTAAYYLFTIGIVCFSGSLYLLACRDLLHIETKFIGPITPLGGLLFIMGWLSLAIAAARSK
ncbi:DUF423 domain-containing protein [Mucilaginibacter sp. UR6-11]|uniref:DUF423 domain-containing protein n=1 Tax=Mucilaginibacter sp. UR6-11 TaxID=1435644 RepID=UPI001E49242C|nr:DUF423 domain-containing protein [Mucilaginibacter sp. UR6-11]MCC8423429.1 DUF423 domain-containing protein [Mucilaginibacter sp. UR6-11]